MGLEESLSKLSTDVQDGDFSVSIKFNHLERAFTDTNRMLILHSDIHYKAENFEWSSVIPTVKIPYRDPALGFLIDGVIFSSVGIYSRAPGIVPDVEKRTLKARTVNEPKVDIVTARNSTISIGYQRRAVQIVFTRGARKFKVPIGIFMKALSGLPYSAILERFAYAPQDLLNAFPCEIPKGSEDLSRAATYGVESTEEPSIEECINMLYSAITQVRINYDTSKYTAHWKLTRINSYFNNLHFKTKQKYEATLAVGNRAVGTYLDEDIRVPIFVQEVVTTEKRLPTGEVKMVSKTVEKVSEFYLPKGHYITDDDAREIRRHDIDTIRVRTFRSFVLQEVTPVFFRAKGYKLISDIAEIGASAGDLIDEELLAKINSTKLGYLEVYTPEGRKVLHRSSEDVELGDFYTILNYLFTHPYMPDNDSTQYEVSNRIILNYEQQVRMEVEQTYSDIVAAIVGSTELRNLLDSFPSLPSTKLVSYLRDAKHKEIAQADLTNVMSRAITEGKSSALMQETPAAMMPVQRGQYGRLDSFHAPDSDKVGSVQQMTVLAKVDDETGEILAPYERVSRGQPTGQIEYITAAKENNKYIVAWDCKLDTPTVLARCNGDVTTVPRERVDYRDPSPFCDMSVSRMCIPFPEFSQPKRALMATKMNGQAVPVLHPERPMVSTGADTEVPSLYYTGRQILEICSIPVVEGKTLEIVGTEWKKSLVDYKIIFNDQVFSFSLPFTATDKESLYAFFLNLKGGSNSVYELDDVVFYNQCCDINQYEYWTRIQQGSLPLFKDHTKPAMALGVNLRVCIKTYGSATVDDALVISDRLITDNTLSSIQILKYTYKLKQGEYFSDSSWCEPLYSHVYAKQPIIRIERNSLKDSSKKEILCKQEGDIVYVERNDSTREAEVWVSTLHHAEIGDKTAGRYGDKSVIAKIVPESMMPYDPADGVAYDVVSSPLSMPSRMNYGRILEIALGAVMLKQSEQGQKRIAVCTPFFPNIKDEVVNLYNSEGLCAKRLFNPVYGKLTERPVMTGVLYIMKLEQMSNLKYRCVGYPTAVDPVFGHPVDSINQDKGQAISEMESWVLIAAGAHNILNSFFSLYSDDESARKAFFKLLEASKDSPDDPWDESFPVNTGSKSVNRNALVTQTIMRMFGCDLEVVGNNYVMTPLVMSDIPITVSSEEFNNGYERVKDFEWFKVPLAAPVLNPFWVFNFPLHFILGVKSIKNLVAGKSFLDINKLDRRDECIVPANSVSEDERMTMLTGIEAVIKLLLNTTIDDAIARIKSKYDNSSKGSNLADPDDVVVVEVLNAEDEGEDAVIDNDLDLGSLVDVPMNVTDVLRFLHQMKAHGQTLDSLVWYEMPIMPRVFRQSNVVGDREHEHSFQQQLKAICSARSTSQGIFDALKDFIGYGKAKQEDLVSIRGYFFGRNAKAGQHGKVRGAVLSKRIGFSGRVVIVPMEDPSISPFFVGLPWCVVCVELGAQLGIRFKKRETTIATRIAEETSVSASSVMSLTSINWCKIIETLGEFNPYVLGNYFPTSNGESDLYFIFHYLRSIVRQLVEGDVREDGMVRYQGEWVDPTTLPDDVTLDCMVVTSGRQPTLHKKSIRTYFGKIVEGYCMRIHPIVCKGYNADFDGDQMWHAQIFGTDKLEGLRTLSVLQDLISEKDGSYTLDLAQDVALGLYCATTFKDNAAEFEGNLGDFHFFDNLEELRTQLEYGDLHYYEAVVFYNHANNSYYCSTAGRVLVNGFVPNAMTQIPFSDAEGICTKVLGADAVSMFKELKYDTVWTVTGIRPNGRPKAVKVANILLEVYNSEGARPSVMTAQALYEIGLIASDVYSVTMTLDDMSSKVDKNAYMDAPRKTVSQLNSLYQLGLITEENRKLASVHAWDTAKKAAQTAIISSLDPASNTYYMMYSGARGKPDQVMQSVGFIGSISKTTQTDIEYPILRGYGEGLTSLDLSQTAYSARIGVISTQAGTKDTGYATRQSVYMTSGLGIKGDSCGIGNNAIDAIYASDQLKIRYPDGRLGALDDLLGEFVEDSTEGFDSMRNLLNRSGFMINEQVLDVIRDNGINSVTILGRKSSTKVEIIYTLDDEWKAKMLEEGYSYALPYTENFKITEKSLEWVERHGLREVIAYDRDTHENGNPFDREAYLPVDYDTMQYRIMYNGETVDNEVLYYLQVSDDSPGLYYYTNLLTESRSLTEKALGYLTKKRIHEIRFKDGSVATIRYSLAKLFRDVVLGRMSVGLPFLDADSCITEETLAEIERYQFDYIPVRTGLTCLAQGGTCSCCYGKSLSSKKFMPDGSNLGIAASQAMCEPLSQATLNVTHSGGNRSQGTGLVSGLAYYTRMLKGSMITGRTASLKESFAECSGYVVQNQHNKSFVQIIDDEKQPHTVKIDDNERLNVPNGAYVDVNDTIVSGLPDLDRYNSTDVFDSALKTRYLLMKEYNKIFSALDVSARNTEILARAQTSICYLVGIDPNAAKEEGKNVVYTRRATAKTRDTGLESSDPTGQYKLMVSPQAQVVLNYTGIASYGFENVANMLLMGLLTPEGLKLNSCLGNLITGTKVGSEEAVFIPKTGLSDSTKYHRSTVKMAQEQVSLKEHLGDFSTILQLGAGDSDQGYSEELEEEILARLLTSTGDMQALPDQVIAETEQPPVVAGAPAFEIESVGSAEAEEEEEAPASKVIDVEFEDVSQQTEDEGEERPQPITGATHTDVNKMNLD